MQCPYCGKLVVIEGATVCDNCGTPFKAVQNQPALENAYLGLTEDQILARAGRPSDIASGDLWLAPDPAQQGWLQGQGNRVHLTTGYGPVPNKIPALIPYQVWKYASKDWVVLLYLTEYPIERGLSLEPCGDSEFESREALPQSMGPRRVVQVIRYRAGAIF